MMDDFIEAQTLRNVVNSRFGHGTPLYGPWAQTGPDAALPVDAIAALCARVRITHRRPEEAFCECWVDGRLRAYCANAGTALVIGAAAIGLDAETMNRVTEGMN